MDDTGDVGNVTRGVWCDEGATILYTIIIFSTPVGMDYISSGHLLLLNCRYPIHVT